MKVLMQVLRRHNFESVVFNQVDREWLQQNAYRTQVWFVNTFQLMITLLAGLAKFYIKHCKNLEKLLQ